MPTIRKGKKKIQPEILKILRTEYGSDTVPVETSLESYGRCAKFGLRRAVTWVLTWRLDFVLHSQNTNKTGHILVNTTVGKLNE